MMMRSAMMLRILTLVAVAMIILTGSSVVTEAREGISITPAIEELVLEEGQEQARLEIDLMNNTDEEVALRISTLDFGALDESGGIAFLGRSGQEASMYGLSRWMKFDKDIVRLRAGQSETIQMQIQNSTELSPGGHYGAVIVSAVNEGRISGDTVAMQPAASTLVLLKKRGGEQYGLELVSQKTNKSLIRLPQTHEITFRNTGNVHIVPRGTVELISPFGSVVAKGTINEQSAYVLPESNRKIAVQFTGRFGGWLPGKYHLRTTWRYDGSDELRIDDQAVWYIGKSVIILMVTVCLVIVLVSYVRYRRRPPTRY